MKYLSIDIETTGLNPDKCQILEIGCVVEDTEHPEIPVVELPTLEFYIDHPVARGEWYALWMNAAIIERIAKKIAGWDYVRPDSASWKLVQFLAKHFPTPEGEKPQKIVLAGKNAANFDLRFLRLLEDWPDEKFRHRLLDPTVYYWHPQTDAVPPETKTCCERAGIEIGALHNAVNDCRLVIELLRRGPEYLFKKTSITF